MKFRVVDYTLYRWRYTIGYILLIILVLSALACAAFYVPGALRDGEVQSALASGVLSMHSIDPMTVVNLPYHILQRLSFLAFGVTTLSIKLPSIILGLLTIFGILLLVKVWFRRNIAIIMVAVATTTTQFLFMAQDGTPAIMFNFVAVWLLVACTYMTRTQIFSTFWKVAACVLTATALYIPLGIYIVLALFITASFHPHIRYMIRRIARIRLIIAILLGLVALVPVGEAIILNQKVALSLLGVPTSMNLQDNILSLGKDIFGFFLASDSYLLRPLYSLGAVVLMAVGAYRFMTVKYTARGYTVFFLILFLVPLVIINPEHVTDLYVLAVLLMAMGVNTLIATWYTLFPRNPYARIAGMIPISVFVVGMVFTGFASFVNNYSYNANALQAYNNDIKLLARNVAANHQQNTKLQVVTTKAQEPFYALVAHYDKRFTVDTDFTTKQTVIMTHDAYHRHTPDTVVSSIITNRRATDADRFYIYKSVAK